jgi:paraquat-inducible protein B
MAEPDQSLNAIPQAQVQERHGPALSMIWLLPLVAALIGGWLVYSNYAERGPLITIRFANAEGIQPNKTRVKYRNVDVGLVEEVRFSRDLGQVVVKVRMDQAFEDRLTDSTRFWVVKPRIEGFRISGLETLISGAYITMDLGKGGAERRVFTGLVEPRTILSDTPGSFYTLRARGLGSLSQGAPVYFRQIAVGEVVGYRIADDHSRVELEIFIRAPHDSQVRTNTRFWNVSGVELDLSAKGLRVGVESLASLVMGGVAFEIPQSLDTGPRAKDGSVFHLYGSREDSAETDITVAQTYVLYFDDSIRGLSIGAPVDFRGLRIGTVTDIAFEAGASGGPIRTPVTIAIEPERVPLADPDEGGAFELLDEQDKLRQVRELMEGIVKAGLRARLQIGSLLTGQLYVDLDFVPDAKPATVVYAPGRPPVLPTVPGTFKDITRSLTRLLGKLDRLPLEEIGQHVEQTVAGANRLVNNEHLHAAMASLASSLARLDRVLAVVEDHSEPVLDTVAKAGEDVRALIADTRAAVRRAEAALKVVEQSVSEDGPMGREILKTLEELSAAARSIRVMTEYLERHPEALIKGKRY